MIEYVFQWDIIFRNYDLFLKGIWLTVRLAGTATFFGLLIGIVGAGCRSFRIVPLNRIVAIYVEIIRNTPFIVQLFFIFFGCIVIVSLYACMTIMILFFFLALIHLLIVFENSHLNQSALNFLPALVPFLAAVILRIVWEYPKPSLPEKDKDPEN